jgi:hypothetical protein
VGERHATRTRELSTQYGYDTKYAMHALRIAYQGQELLTTGRITLPIVGPERERLLEVRHGQVPLRQVLERLHHQQAMLEDAVLSSRLRDDPDHDAVNMFLVDAYQRAWNGELRTMPELPRPRRQKRGAATSSSPRGGYLQERSRGMRCGWSSVTDLLVAGCSASWRITALSS